MCDLHFELSRIKPAKRRDAALAVTSRLVGSNPSAFPVSLLTGSSWAQTRAFGVSGLPALYHRVSARLAYSVRNASIGEMRLALNAGINEATNADSANAAMAVSTTEGLYGFIP
jgi:hypothetical protein